MEKADLKKELLTLSEENRHITSVKETLEQRLNMEKTTVSLSGGAVLCGGWADRLGWGLKPKNFNVNSFYSYN
jgi:hypothetical protein